MWQRASKRSSEASTVVLTPTITRAINTVPSIRARPDIPRHGEPKNLARKFSRVLLFSHCAIHNLSNHRAMLEMTYVNKLACIYRHLKH